MKTPMALLSAIRYAQFKMTTRLINILLILYVLTCDVCGQTLKEKVEMLFDKNKTLIEKTQEFYNMNGQVIKSVRSDYKTNESIAITDYCYNEKGQRVKEVFSELRSYQDSSKMIRWTDTSIISITHFQLINKSLLYSQIYTKNEYTFNLRMKVYFVNNHHVYVICISDFCAL